MRLLLFLTASLALLSGCARPVQTLPPPQEIGGTLTTDTLLDGHYLLVADLHVPAGVTLRIAPGTHIDVQPSDSTKIDPEYLSRETEILVRGQLLAKGTALRPILIRPVADDKRAILWGGIAFVEGARGELSHVQLEQAESGILCLDASPQLQSVSILRSRYGILLQKGSAPRIEESLLKDGEAGLFCWDQSAPEVFRSQILEHREEGVYLGRNCKGLFTDNLVTANDRGVVLPAGLSLEPSNQIRGNRQDVQTYGSGGSP